MPLWLTLLIYIIFPVGIFSAVQFFVLTKAKRRVLRLLPVICAGVALAVSVASGIYVIVFGDFLSLAMLDIMVTAGVCALAVIGCAIGKFAAKLLELKNSDYQNN